MARRCFCPPDSLAPRMTELMEEGALRKGRKADVWFPVDRSPHRHVGVQAVGERISLVTESGGRANAELGG